MQKNDMSLDFGPLVKQRKQFENCKSIHICWQNY